MASRILITGGAGFIGSNLCDLFINEGHEVICIDNLISGSRDNISHLFDNPSFKFIEHDITQPLEQDLGSIDAVLHFASPASPNPDSSISYMANPVETLMVNSLGTKNMLDLANKNNCQIILASTSEVYGDPEIHPQTEEYWGNVSPNGPRSCYDESKRFMESIAFTYFRKFNTKVKVIRIFNTYGPRMSFEDGRFIPNLFKSYILDVPFTKFADDKTTRSFCYISDLLDGIKRVFDSSEMVGEVVNLGNPQEYSISEAIDIFESHIGKLQIQELPELKDDPKRRQPDISKAKKLLGWEPKVEFPDGLMKTLAYFKKE